VRWKGRDARLTAEEARARLRAIVQKDGSPSLVARHPLSALAIALAAGFFVCTTARYWPPAGRGVMWLLGCALPSVCAPTDTPLEKLKARIRRRQ
jgi:uncharacterized protein (DUF1684 family)